MEYYFHSRFIDNDVEKLYHMPKVSYLVSGRAGIWQFGSKAHIH